MIVNVFVSIKDTHIKDSRYNILQKRNNVSVEENTQDDMMNN